MTCSRPFVHQVNLTAIDIFTGKKLEDMSPSTHNMSVPVVKRKDYQLLDVDSDGFLSLMNDDGSTKDDLKIPEGEIGDEIRVCCFPSVESSFFACFFVLIPFFV